MDAFLVPLRNPPFSSSSAAFILIYYGHGFFGTKICLLYKKRAKYKKKVNEKQQQISQKPSQSFSDSKSEDPAPESRDGTKADPSTHPQTTTSTLPHPYTHTIPSTWYSHKRRTAEGIAAADLEI